MSAREGDLEGAVAFGRHALSGDQKSLPSLKLASSDLVAVLNDRFAGEAKAVAYLDELREI